MLLKLEVRSVAYDSTILYWAVEPDLNEYIHNFGYFIEVSESLQGPWTAVNVDPIYAFGYVDKRTQHGMVDQRLYYRVVARHESHEAISAPVCLATAGDNYLAHYIAKQESLLLRRYNGSEFLHFARKKFGDRCTQCYDVIERKSIRAKCPECYGTTYKNGYFAPVKIYINLDPQPKSIDKGEHGVTEANTVTGWTSNWSIIEGDDVLILLEQPNTRYLVTSVLPTAMKGTVVKQALTLMQLKADNPSQLIPLDVDAYTLDEFSVFRREWKAIR